MLHRPPPALPSTSRRPPPALPSTLHQPRARRLFTLLPPPAQPLSTLHQRPPAWLRSRALMSRLLPVPRLRLLLTPPLAQHTPATSLTTRRVLACGWTSSSSDNIVAIAHGIMDNGANPNNNPLCGQTITISYQGSTHQAKVVDTCPGCEDAAIDLSPSLFEAVAPNGDGRVHGVEWWFNSS